MPVTSAENLAKRASRIRMLLLDVDGVLTDGTIVYGSSSTELKLFDVQDGFGIVLARAVGIKVGILTARVSEAVERRASELALDEVVQGSQDKSASFQDMLLRQSMSAEEVAFIGDDWPDLPILQKVGLPIAVANARPEVKAASVMVTDSPGGRGAVREAIEWLLGLRGEKAALLERFARGEFGGATP